MILTLYTEDFFDAAHHLQNYNGKCSCLHGHTWKVCVWIQGDDSLKNEAGILWDFNNLKKVISVYDHSNLNDVCKCNPTAENLAQEIYTKLKSDSPNLSFRIRLYEKATTKSSYCELGDF